ncbi:hypothetical protein [Paraflavitalea speifideaquila]|uniref:hypothetical protein n=1 Tax=Paraflavitalea speifideaquila TaxID=3076558 RepID=UPI0028E99DFF|nr:hypothetical protein [Paraflavitalea speifideiaquila]
MGQNEEKKERMNEFLHPHRDTTLSFILEWLSMKITLLNIRLARTYYKYILLILPALIFPSLAQD